MGVLVSFKLSLYLLSLPLCSGCIYITFGIACLILGLSLVVSLILLAP